MKKPHYIFKKTAAKVAFDLVHRDKLLFNILQYEKAVDQGLKRYADLQKAKDQASATKDYVVANLPLLLSAFEDAAIKNGAEVFWAADTGEAVDIISEVLHEHSAKMLVKSKSMVTEELDLNHRLEEVGIESVETDLGEFIVQVAGEKPYHIVTPAMHKSKNDVAKLFHENFGTSLDLTATELTNYVRGVLREKFMMADAGVTGANFLCAKEGVIAVTENEGNALMSMAWPKLHIVIAGIEKVLPSVDDLPLFWPLLAAHGTGQQVTVYSNLIYGPRKSKEVDGPERMVIVLLDNRRSEIYKNTELRASLKCIRCGACLNYCPVYKSIGGYTYNCTYSGPIGSVISPHLKDFESLHHLSFASSLCGKCNEVCPVQIPLNQLLLYNRQQSKKHSFFNRSMYRVLSSRPLMNSLNGQIKSKLMRLFEGKLFDDRKKMPHFSQKSFNKQWRNKNKS